MALKKAKSPKTDKVTPVEGERESAQETLKRFREKVREIPHPETEPKPD